MLLTRQATVEKKRRPDEFHFCVSASLWTAVLVSQTDRCECKNIVYS